jgi:cell division protein FtsB
MDVRKVAGLRKEKWQLEEQIKRLDEDDLYLEEQSFRILAEIQELLLVMAGQPVDEASPLQ